MTYVSDTVAGFLSAGLAKAVEGMTINLGTGSTYSVGWFAERILTLMGAKKAIVQENERMRPEQSEVNKLVSDNRLAARVLDWSPRVSLDEGLLHTIEFAKANPTIFDVHRYVI
jgi:dTDP-glucose 4,6-dehydratase